MWKALGGGGLAGRKHVSHVNYGLYLCCCVVVQLCAVLVLWAYSRGHLN